MKKLTSLMLSAVMLLALAFSTVTVNAQGNNMETVLASVKARVEIPAEYTEFSSSSQSEYGFVSYYFDWCSSEYNRNMNVRCYDDGTITEYSNYSFDSDGSPSIPKMSVDDAVKLAEDFVKQINPDFPYEIKVTDNGRGSLYGGDYSFGIDIYVNGILFSDGKGSINVNGNTGNIEYFRIGYIPAQFPAVENAISRAEAEKAYSDNLGLEMIYRTSSDKDGKTFAYPVYVPAYSYGRFINALTGDVTILGAYADRNYAMGMEDAASASSAMKEDGGFTEQEIRELQNIQGLISQADIEKQIRNNKILSVPKEIGIASISLNKAYNNDDYSYYVRMSGEGTNIYIYLDAKTGEILHYNRYGEDRSGDTVNRNDDAFGSLAGDKADEYKYNEENKSYERYVNGIRVSGDNAYITYRDGVLENYSISYTETDFPSLEGAMSKEEAEKVMFEAKGYEMKYITDVTKNTLSIIPVYMHESVSINPFNGKFVDYSNEEISDNDGKIEYSDLSGHYAEKYIKELAYYGVGFEGGEFRPDEKITQKDFLALLMSVHQSGIVVMRNDSEQADYVYRRSVRNNIISEEERDDSANVTREMAAVYMIRAMGAETYAKYDDIYVTPFKDVTQHKGYIALLSAMSVVSGGGDGLFNPQREITRAESAVMIYNYLTR